MKHRLLFFSFLSLILADRARAVDPFSLLHTFGTYNASTSSYSDGMYPHTPVQGSDGNFYGVTGSGGDFSRGVIYQMKPDGTTTGLYSFTGYNDGYGAQGVLLEAGTGVFFGTNVSGGNDSSGADPTQRQGTVFQYSNGALVTLYAFPRPADPQNAVNDEGASPNGNLYRIADTSDGKKVFIGSTSQGGHNKEGTIFSLATDGTKDGTTVSTLYHFPASGSTTAGTFTFGHFVKVSNSLLYGLTSSGGPGSQGTFFKLTTDGTAAGTVVTALYAFGYPDSVSLPITLTQAADANGKTVFLGVCANGGGSAGGAVFKLTTDGTAANTAWALVHSFPGGTSGYHPEGTLAADGQGNFYGTTDYTGFNAGNGLLYRVTPAGGFTVLHTFADGEGSYLSEGPVVGADGNLYGISASGGANNSGLAYSYPLAGTTGGGGTSDGSLGINVKMTSDSDPITGQFARAGDTVTYEYDFSAIGADAKDLQIDTLIPYYVHADSTLKAKFTKGSKSVEVLSNNAQELKVGGVVNAPAGVLLGNATIASIQDAKHLTLSLVPSKTLAADCVVKYDGQQYQFDPASVTFSGGAGGEIVQVLSLTDPISGDWSFPQGSGTAHVDPIDSNHYARYAVKWTPGNYAAGTGYNVKMFVKIPAAAKIDSLVTHNLDFEIHSTSGAPSTGTGFTGSGSYSYNIRGPISISAYPDNAAVAPGGLFSVDFFVENLSTQLQRNAVAVVDLPNNARFDFRYPDVNSHGTLQTGLSFLYLKPGGTGYVPYSRKPAGLTYARSHGTGGVPDQIIVSLGALRPGAEAVFRITFQAQWVDPASVPQLQTAGYGAAYLDADGLAAYAVLQRAAGAHDYLAFIRDTDNRTAASFNDSGLFSIPVSGSNEHAPHLHLLKHLINAPHSRIFDANLNEYNAVRAGETITFSLFATNTGPNEANDVFIQDAFLEQSSYVVGSAVLTSTSASTKKSKLVAVPDPDGHHVQFTGLHLDASDCLTIQYQVKINSDVVNGTLLDPAVAIAENEDGEFVEATASIGTTSQPETELGYYLNDPVKVDEVVQFAQPEIRALVPKPHVTTDVTATAAKLTAMFAKQSARDTTSPTRLPLLDVTKADSFVPGFERFYIHYENQGATVARAKLEVPLPAHTAFYRASFVTLSTNEDATARGNLPGTLAALPRGATITVPSDASNVVTFNFATLARGASGEVMVEVIVKPDAVQRIGSVIGVATDLPVKLSDAAGHQAAKVFQTIPLGTPQNVSGQAPVRAPYHTSALAGDPAAVVGVPDVGLLKITQKTAPAGGSYFVTYIFFNADDSASPPLNFFLQTAAGSQYQLANYTQAFGASYTTDGTNAQFSWTSLPAHQAVAVTAQFTCTADPGGAIGNDVSYATVPQQGRINASAQQPNVGGHQISARAANVFTTSIVGRPLHTFTVDGNVVDVVDEGGGNSLVHAASEVIAGGNTLSQWNGYTVIDGSAVGVGGTTALNLLSHYSDGAALSTVHATPATVLVPPGCLFMLPANGVGVLASGGLLGGGAIVAQGGGNIVAQGGGNIVAQGGGNIVAQGGGNIVAQGGGNAVPPGATIVAQGGGNLIGQDGNGIVAQGGGNVAAASLPGSSATLVNTNGSNIVAQGGGNAVQQF